MFVDKTGVYLPVGGNKSCKMRYLIDKMPHMRATRRNAVDIFTWEPIRHSVLGAIWPKHFCTQMAPKLVYFAPEKMPHECYWIDTLIQRKLLGLWKASLVISDFFPKQQKKTPKLNAEKGSECFGNNAHCFWSLLLCTKNKYQHAIIIRWKIRTAIRQCIITTMSDLYK